MCLWRHRPKVMDGRFARKVPDLGHPNGMSKWLSSLAEGTILPALKTFDALKLGRGAVARALFAPLLMYLGFASNSTESAIANGETRTISLSNSHTDESGSFPYMVNGVYDSAVLEK